MTEQQNENDDRHAFKSGARSSGRLPGFHRIPWHLFASRLAARYQIGAERYGDDNWKNGIRKNDKDFIIDRANHLLDHAHKAVEEIKNDVRSSDDNLAAVLWGAICLIAWQDRPRTGTVPIEDLGDRVLDTDLMSERCKTCNQERRHHSIDHPFVFKNGEYAFTCAACPAVFKARGALLSHIREGHPDPLDKEAKLSERY